LQALTFGLSGNWVTDPAAALGGGMVRFIGRWLSDAMTLACALFVAAMAMQIPALTRNYADALLQVSGEARRDIDRREATAVSFYHLSASGDAAVIAALRPLEPSNADSLALSVSRAQALRDEYDRILASPELLQPITAILDIGRRGEADTSSILRTVIDTYSPQVLLTQAAAIYAVAGLLLGSLISRLVQWPLTARGVESARPEPPIQRGR